MNKILQEDIETFSVSNEFRCKLESKTFLVTGSTGLLGSIFVKCLQNLNLNIQFILPVRNIEKAQIIFNDNFSGLNLIQSELIPFLKEFDEPFDYAFHFASPTDGKFMKDFPVDTFELAIDSTKELLKLCRRLRPKGCLYISSIEFYGENFDDHLIMESDYGNVSVDNPRSSYPLGKKAAEFLAKSYAWQYGLPVKIARLTQTFGAGVSSEDKRVFTQFAKSVNNGSDIILHTDGKSSKPYCYTTDCISALIYILLLGKNGESYNVCTPDTYISIYDLATFLQQTFAPDIKVIKIEKPNSGYAPETHLKLSPEKLLSLGWKPQYNLKQMFERLISSLK